MGCLGNCIWFLCGGILSGLSWVASGVLCCITIIGIPIGMQCFKFAGLAFFPFGLQFFKIAKLALMPFGAEIVG